MIALYIIVAFVLGFGCGLFVILGMLGLFRDLMAEHPPLVSDDD